MTEQVRRLVAELLGVFFLLLIGGLAILGDGSTVAVALGFGLALLAGLYAFGEVSGGHFNPAVSLGAMLDGRLSTSLFVQYAVAQIAGGVLAGLALMWAANQDAVAATATTVNVETGSAFILEAVLAAIFVAVILKVTTSESSAATSYLAIGLTYAVVHIAALGATGASVNPARSLGSAIVGNTYDDIWLYIVAPLVGGAVGWVLYRLVSGKSLKPEMS